VHTSGEAVSMGEHPSSERWPSEEEWEAIEWSQNIRDWRGLPFCTRESTGQACLLLDLIFEERELLAAYGIDWRPYNCY
jgi:hypothetical protein